MKLTLPTDTVQKINSAKAGAMIREARKKRGISLRALSAEMKISFPYLSDLELARRGWSENLFTLAALGIAKLSKK